MEQRFSENCMVCGSELEHLEKAKENRCVYCGESRQSYFICPKGHFVCDNCHANQALIKLTGYCLNSKLTNPMAMLEDIMADSSVAMHGPEHHAIVPAILVTAYRNATGALGEEAILEAIRRGSKIPGGYCGIYGACGAGIGTGVAVAVITGSTPLKAEPRAMSNLMTAQALSAISQQGGVRCCKSCSRQAVEAAVEFYQRYLNCSLETIDSPSCTYMKRNAQCNLAKCRYFPGRKPDSSTGNGLDY